MTRIDTIFIVCDNSYDSMEAYTDQDEAEAMSNARQTFGYGAVGVKALKLRRPAADKGNANGTPTPSAKMKKSKKTVELSSSAEGSDELTTLASDGNAETPKAKKPRAKKSETAASAPKDIPGARDNALAGLKFIFFGTLSMNHPTACATATKYGATIAKKVDAAHYVVQGKNASAKQVESINTSGAERITEDAFVAMIQSGAPYDKLQDILSETMTAEPPKKKQKKV